MFSSTGMFCKGSDKNWPRFKFEFGTILVYKNLQELVTWIYTIRTWIFFLWDWEYSLDPNLLVNIENTISGHTELNCTTTPVLQLTTV